MICRILCEGLVMDEIMDAVECFHQMESQLTVETLMPHEVEWIRGKQ